MDRRTALAAMLATGLTVAGCDLLAPEPPPPHPLSGLLIRTRALLARYRAVIGAHPGLADRLTPLRDNHQAHVDELARLVVPSPSAAPSATPVTGVAADERTVLRQLRDAEQTAQQAATEACLVAKPEYAGLIGSIAACRAVHREVLR